MSRVLLVIGGIAKNLYAGKQTEKLFTRLKKLGINTDIYDGVIELDTEKVTDQNKWKVLDRVPWWDQWRDIRGFFLETKKRDTVCQWAKKIIRGFNNKNIEIDVVAHSLGSCIAMCAGDKKYGSKPVCIDFLVLMGSPIAFKYLWIDKYVRSFIKRHSHNLKANGIVNLWSKHDFVSNHFKKPVKKLLSRFQERSVSGGIVDRNTQGSHSFMGYLRFLVMEFGEHIFDKGGYQVIEKNLYP